MKKTQQSIFALLFLITIIAGVFFFMMPQNISRDDTPLNEFSLKRALSHVNEISAKPHYVGSDNHNVTADYIQQELRKLGLEPTIQEGTTLSDWGNLVKSKNILARIKGSGSSQALMLLSHYDSAPHSSSPGASDNAVGVATILEGIRAFIHNKTPHKNDIIILFSDAEELGLNGAALFVTQSGWASQTGLVLNFEARGTAGPSYMLMEVAGGNSAMVKGFQDAKTTFPVANSLMYSVYKMLPNDTDLTVFREQAGIQGFNFAFIDDHFNYHTAQDDIDHLDQRSLQHQGSYLMPLLKHFSNENLAALKSDEDHVYFSIPFGFVNYPFSFIYPMLIVASLLFLFLVFIGIGKRNLVPRLIGKGFINLLLSIAVCGILGFFIWKTLLLVYPQYTDILHGFTYNGHYYILAFCFLALTIGFIFFNKPTTEIEVMSQTVAPITIWLLINLALAIYLPGAAFLIIPVFAVLIMFGYYVVLQRTNLLLNLVMSIPAIIIIVPFIWMFPIGLGLKVLFGSMILTVLTFSILLPVSAAFHRKYIFGGLSAVLSIILFVYAHLNSDYQPGKAKPNSLVYILDADTKKAEFATYDTYVDDWTAKYLGNKPKEASHLNVHPLFSKYNSGFTMSNHAPVVSLAQPTITFLRDSIIGNQRHLKISIKPNRRVNRYDIFANQNLTIHNLRANGATALGQKGSPFLRRNAKILSYYVVDQQPLELSFSINKNAPLDFHLLEASFDLLSNSNLKISERPTDMIPKPFVLTDAVIIKKKIAATPVTPIAVPPAAVPLRIVPMQPTQAAPFTPIDTTRLEN